MNPNAEMLQVAIAELQQAGGLTPAVVERLRKRFGASLAGPLISMAGLQPKARAKLGEGVWLVSERSLQQATAWQVARLKASWIGGGTVYDLCCGIGGDSTAFAAVADVVAVDIDPIVAEYAAANLRQALRAANGYGGATWGVQVLCQDVLRLAVPSEMAVHIDPDRRPGERRTRQPDRYQPPLESVLRIIANARSGIIKLAPAAEIPQELRQQAARCWISLSGSVREQSLLFGEAIDRSGLAAGDVAAVCLDKQGRCDRFSPIDFGLQGVEEFRLSNAEQPQAILVDPDPAIRAAGLTEAFAAAFGLQPLGSPAGFLTGDWPPQLTQLRSMAMAAPVVWSGRFDQRTVRRELRSRNAKLFAIKNRGSGDDPVKIAQQLHARGDHPLTLWISRVGDRVIAALTDQNLCPL